EISRSGIATHDLSPSLFLERLMASLPEGCRVRMLAVQPASVAFGEGLSGELEQALSALLKLLWGHNT
ncbi:hypothetical protein JW921_00140, partial [Candidatus Fermentibacterales bacterium]|nr:hypothetical protein [Candidatus Fermentibacterales bacterium]